ncbi:MAG: hypothetical protein EAS51_03970 [Microbacteriaceae bacterium]|nr:MAG: hypothetical protein EAS51_03970 [Microbacteriaceae bacterium]
MNPRGGRVVRATAEIVRERRTRALEFWQSAENLHELDGDGNSIVSLYVLAGIAASDAICGARLGEYAQGESHADALAMLKRAEPTLVASLQRLLSRKTEWAYGGAGVSASRVETARAAATKLVEAAKLIAPA